uniref:NADH-ubiquinone oxidoreductase chain 6 n=1 Tax=Liriomyza bryoniae TaxID=127404 RepID=R4HIH0_LIRBR|nr:NADH dehydrogenase subunit 6 [Liriomyza bryoniae]AEO51707.1 NADH dehydrogenase subunit 6 [Liriomyza bryoniae]
MIQSMISLMLMISSFIFLQMTHPLALGLMLLIQTTLMSLLTGMIMKTFWFSYILFLIFLGGMLVLFIYTTSLASNEMFSFSMKIMMITMMMFFIGSMIFFFMDKTMIYNMFMNTEMMNLTNMISFTSENTITLYKLYNFPTNFTTILLVNYLLITMIAVVKITNLFFGPLRMMN